MVLDIVVLTFLLVMTEKEFSKEIMVPPSAIRSESGSPTHCSTSAPGLRHQPDVLMPLIDDSTGRHIMSDRNSAAAIGLGTFPRFVLSTIRRWMNVPSALAIGHIGSPWTFCI